MFRKLAQRLGTVTKGQLTTADRVFTFHPEQLSRWLEEVWAQGGIAKWDTVISDQRLPLDDMIRNRRDGQRPRCHVMASQGSYALCPAHQSSSRSACFALTPADVAVAVDERQAGPRRALTAFAHNS
jgi:hypothetical protein